MPKYRCEVVASEWGHIPGEPPLLPRSPTRTSGAWKPWGMVLPCGKFNFKAFVLPYDPAIPFLGKDPGKKKKTTIIWKDTRTPVLTAALCNSKTRTQSKCPRPERRTKETRHSRKMGHRSATKWAWRRICGNMHGPRDCHTEWRQTEKDKYRLISHICRTYGAGQQNILLWWKCSVSTQSVHWSLATLAAEWLKGA